MLLFFFALAVVVVAAWIFLRPGRRAGDSVAETADFRAVTVRLDPTTACPAAMELDHVRYLCSEAPPLPLAKCTAATCTCTFEHHEDRREGPRRAGETGIFEPLYARSDRREQQRGRRAEDQVDPEGAEQARERAEARAREREQAEQFDPSATYYDFVAQTGIVPDAGD